ncbi:MAG: biotin--[acetyl-CoA-carboxylase] ligase [Clostridia bacterium]
MIKQSVLEALEAAYPDYVSGAGIARTLRVSRNAVWKAVGALSEAGLGIASMPGRGYRLCEAPSRVSKAAIESLLDAPDFYHIMTMAQVDSTNARLKAMAVEGAEAGTVLIAARQSAGRGRLGRAFFSPDGSGLYMSILLRPTLAASDALQLTTAAAVAVCEAIEQTSGKSAHIKWVNDVLIDGLKVCGILTEAQLSIEDGGLKWAVVGIGLNVCDPEGGFPKALDGIAGSILGAQCEPDARNRLAAAVLNRFERYRLTLDARTHLAGYRARAQLIGQRIDVIRPGSTRRALAKSIDDACGLCVRYEDGSEETLSSGEVSTVWRENRP